MVNLYFIIIEKLIMAIQWNERIWNWLPRCSIDQQWYDL